MNILKLDYQGLPIHANREAWFNATGIEVKNAALYMMGKPAHERDCELAAITNQPQGALQ